MLDPLIQIWRCPTPNRSHIHYRARDRLHCTKGARAASHAPTTTHMERAQRDLHCSQRSSRYYWQVPAPFRNIGTIASIDRCITRRCGFGRSMLTAIPCAIAPLFLCALLEADCVLPLRPRGCKIRPLKTSITAKVNGDLQARTR